MKYQPLNDLIDPDVPPPDAIIPEPEEHDPEAPNNAYVIGEHGNTVQAPDASGASSAEDGPKPWVKPMAIALVVLCAGLTFWNLTRAVSGPPAPPKPSAFQVKQALYLGVMRLEAFRRVHGVTPDSLTDAGLQNPPYGYMRLSSTQYVVSIQLPGSSLEYDSSTPMQRFFGTPQEMLSIGGTQ